MTDRRDTTAGFTRGEYGVLAIVLSVQFINIVEGVMLVPMGPLLADGLHMPVTRLGFISGAYVLASCVVGLFNALLLDRFDRRRALGLSTIGLAIGTILGASAIDVQTMMAARVVAGVFGGTCSALSLAIIADTISAERRGRAMGLVAAAFTAATVFGIPLGFQLAAWGSWRTPFYVVGVLGFGVALGVYRLLPRLEQDTDRAPVRLGQLFGELGVIVQRPVVRLSLAAAVSNVVPGGLIVPVLAPYFVHNLGYPEHQLGLLWAAGGIVGLVAATAAGRAVDKSGPILPIFVISGIMLAHWVLLFLFFQPSWPLMPAFAVYIGLNISRMTVASTVLTQVTPAHERGRFLSLASVAQNGGMGIGAFATAAILTERPDGGLGNIGTIIAVAAVFILLTPWLMAALWRRMPADDRVLSRDRVPEEVLAPMAGD